MPYQIAFYPDMSAIPPQSRDSVARSLDVIADRIWVKDPEYWRSQGDIFQQANGLLLATSEGAPVAFMLYQRLTVDGASILYGWATNIIPEHQGRRLLKQLNSRFLEGERQRASAGPLYFAARTRNPIVWDEVCKYCKRVVPRLDGGPMEQDLMALARRVAAVLFPGVLLDTSAMILRGAYSAFAYRAAQQHRDPQINARLLKGEGLTQEDALFVFGELKD